MITVSKIIDTRNPEIKTLELRTVSEKVNLDNPIGFFMKGATNIHTNYETRVAYLPVSTKFMEENNVELGCDFGKSINKECRIVIRETLYPVRKKKDGSNQEPKKVPNTNYYLTKDDQPIYRNYYLELDPDKFTDELIQHDPIPDHVRKMIQEKRAVFNGTLFSDLSSSNIMTEPTLD